MKGRLAWVAGAMGVAGAYAWRRLRQPYAEPPASEPPAAPDPRAEELRRALEESRALADEGDAFEGEPPVDAEDPEERRRGVHERGRAAVDEMRGGEQADA